jgi:hypothetical protein
MEARDEGGAAMGLGTLETFDGKLLVCPLTAYTNIPNYSPFSVIT